MRFIIFILLIISSCQTNNIKKLKPSDTNLKHKEKNWEYLYAIELKRALENEDDLAFYFFWPYYLQERYNNKLNNDSH